MKILHLSDIHLTENGIMIWDTDTMSHFNRAIELIRSMKNIDAIIITEDLSNNGSYWTYKYIDDAFSSIGIPTFCCPENHDDVEIMFSGYNFHFIGTERRTIINGWKILILDSSMPEMARGILDHNKMSLLKNKLSSDNRCTIIAFYHPSIEPDGWLNRKLLDNRKEFNKLIAEYSNVKLVLYGYIHYCLQHKFGETVFSTTPSIGYAFNPNLAKFQIAVSEEGFNVILLLPCKSSWNCDF